MYTYYTYYFAKILQKVEEKQERKNIYSQPSNVNVSELKSEKNTVLQLET